MAPDEMRPNEDSMQMTDEKTSLHETEPEAIPSPTPEEISPIREATFVFLCCSAQLLTQATLAQTVITNRILAETFDVLDKPGEQSWFAAAFSLTVGTFILISGRLGDLYGYKTIYCVAFVILSIGSLISGLTVYAKSSIFFDVMRGVQGLGLSFAFPNAVALISHYFPMGMKRIIYMCLFAAVAPGGFVIGSLFTTTISVKGWWPWCFYVLSIVSLAHTIIGYYAIPSNIGNHNSYKNKEDKPTFDYLGSITGVVGLILINFAFNQGPNVGWDKVYVYVLLIVGFLFIAAFFVVERKVKHPLVPKEVLTPETGFVLGVIGAGWSSFGIWLFYLARFSIELNHYGYIQTAVHFIPVLIMGYVASGVTAVIVGKVPVSIILFASMVAFFGANALIALKPIGQTYWIQNFICYFVSAFAMDMSFPAATIMLADSLPKSQQGMAASLVSTFVNYSISLGLGFAATVEYYRVQGKPQNEATTELGIRNALYMGMGLAGLGIVLSVVFGLYQRRKHQNNAKQQSANENLE